MVIVNEFYDGMIEEMPAEVLHDFFVSEIREFLEDKISSVLGKLLSNDPVSAEEVMTLLDRSFDDTDFMKTFVLTRLRDFSASCKTKNASNQWVLDYFYLCGLKELLQLKKVEKVTKTPELADRINVTVSQIDTWISKLEVPSSGLFKKKTDTMVENIDADELYNTMTNLTANVFQVYHSLIAGKEKERNDVNYAYKLSIDEVDFDDVDLDDIKDAVKAAKIQKGSMALNVFENMLALFYIRQCR
ncbi:hypothetical protein [Eubacterium oxidoreducens]|uniref:Uncharacterized protein n=1 Tax=Eubacterium oxidoreducens TaxID=1732 RepID=A0A1G6C1E7_EUBOX|nr:hypothetical protein [Eubacterium oxidoreducens]SDB26703.1 hypothetical protein SAMN02910417_01976 [Eubacterium oxidoreducens]